MVHLDGNRINDTSDFETAFFELHYWRIVDASSLGENQNGQFFGIIHVLFQSVKKDKNFNWVFKKYKNILSKLTWIIYPIL